MVHTFIRSRSYYISRKRRRINKKSTIKRITKFKKLIRRRLYRPFLPNETKSLERKEYLSESYFRRYIFPKGRPLYKRTIGFKLYHSINYRDENLILLSLKQDLKRQETYRMLNNKLITNSNHRPLSTRSFFFGRVYLTHRRRNTFITINKTSEDILDAPEQVIFKASCGLLDYAGPKRSTYHARLSVAKAASSFLTEQEFTSIDIIFPSGIGRIFTRLVKALCENHIYVRYILSLKRRSHGHTRRKKMRRL